MRLALFGDIHANLEALDAVLEDAEKSEVDRYACLGDVVGYGPNPSECLVRVREHCHVVVQGNHDAIVSSDHEFDGINPVAKSALLWTREHLTEDERQWLAGLPLVEEDNGITFVHASLDEPSQWRYVHHEVHAWASMVWQKTPLCFHGHTHRPRIFEKERKDFTIHQVEGSPPQLEIAPEEKWFLINVGSVGQPRDGDERACYAIYDTESNLVTFRRVDYDVEQAQEKIASAGLPLKLAARLALGR